MKLTANYCHLESALCSKAPIRAGFICLALLFLLFWASENALADVDKNGLNLATVDESEPAEDGHLGTVDLQSITDEKADEQRCHFEQENSDWIDNLRFSTHGRLCKTALWFDGLFGDEHEFNDEDFRGKVSVGFRQDEDDGFDPRLRVKIRTKLPNVSRKFNAFVGRVEEDSYISNTEVEQGQLNTVGLRSVDDDDAEWLVGIGYRNPDENDNGFDVSVGAKLSSGLNPYAKLAHRYILSPRPNQYWKSTQTVFWRRDEGYGYSSTFDYTNILGDWDILEWDVGARYTENSEQWEWITSSTWHHSFTDKKGISTRGYVRGESENEVSIPEFGVTFTYVRPFLRPWLSIETGVDFRWEREIPGGEYQSVTRVGIQFEMLLGDYYSRRPRLKD